MRPAEPMMTGGMPQHMGPGYGMDVPGNSAGQQDWICPSCGNKNYASRTECNMRKCRAPRPDAGMGGMGGPPMGGPPVVFHPMHSGAAFGKRAAEDFSGGPNKRMRDNGGGEGADWTCPLCNNVNFASRMVCNMRKCGAPRPDPSAPLPFNRGDTMGWGGPKRGAPVSASNNDEWVCIQCGNINYSTRQNCNMRICGAPRPGTAGGAAPAKVEKAAPTPQAGDWVCPKCSNVNFSSRTVCNMRKCQAPKPKSDEPAAEEAEAEAPAAEADKTDGEAAGAVTSDTTTEAQAPSDAAPESS